MEQWELDEIRSRLESYLLQKGLSLRKPFRCLNPDHEDRHPSMSYNRRADNVHCFSCGATFDLFDLIGMDYGLETFPARLEKAQALLGSPGGQNLTLVVGRPGSNHRGGQEESPLSGREKGLEALAGQATGRQEYLLARGITGEQVERYGLFQTEKRAVFPVRECGALTGWCARAISQETLPRYQNSPGPLGIWNGDLLSRPPQDKLYITEGIVDALSLENAGCSALALCGAQNTGKFLRRCATHREKLMDCILILCGDGDPAGQDMNRRLATGLGEMGLRWSVLSPGEGRDWNDLLLSGELEALLAGSPVSEGCPDRGIVEGDDSAVPQAGEPPYEASSAAAALDAFFREREARGGREAVSTGISGLDKLLDGGFYPGLYVMGAISSLGKTSLALQMADHIAANDRDVLFVSLEQSRFELMAKSLSRLSAELGREGGRPFTARQLLSGEPAGGAEQERLLDSCRAAYAATAGGLFLREGMADLGVGAVRRMVEDHRRVRGQAPVVVVDYLQILSPADPRLSDKQNTDRAVVELKRISRDFDTPVLAISSFNRENYRAAASMEAFKESGAVEYSADVLLGLQLRGAGGRDFDANQAKLREPRQLELVILKNRNGTPYAKIPMEYDAKYNRFWQGRSHAVRLA